MNWLFTACLALLQDPPPQPAPQDPLQDRLEKLEKLLKEIDRRNTELTQKLAEQQKEMEDLKQALDNAQTAALNRSKEIMSLRQQITSLEEDKTRLQEEVSRARGEGNPNEVGVPVGPSEPMMGFVVGIGKDYEFVMINIDKKSPKDEPKVGYEFEIVRDQKTVALGEVVNLHGSDPKQVPKLQLKIIRGEVREIRPGDTAIAKRKLSVAGPVKKEGRVAKISGKLGKDLYGIDAGRNEGLSIGDKVFIYRKGGNKIVGVLRLELVEFESSVGRIIEGSQDGVIDLEDAVHFEEVGLPKKQIIARVAYAEKDIVIDVGSRGGARPGQKYEVRRQGKVVSRLQVKDARYDHSYCEPCDGHTREEVKKDDVVELIKD
jgi:prefoldin subunit 5